jgi:hypothetical protein
MARKCVSAHLRSAWQHKTGVIHRYAKDTILKNLFSPVLLRIRVCVGYQTEKIYITGTASYSTGTVIYLCHFW